MKKKKILKILSIIVGTITIVIVGYYVVAFTFVNALSKKLQYSDCINGINQPEYCGAKEMNKNDASNNIQKLNNQGGK